MVNRQIYILTQTLSIDLLYRGAFIVVYAFGTAHDERNERITNINRQF